jgi:nucleotide-binding universal stress UspA family protein
LDEAVSRARLVAPEGRVTPRLVTGPAGCALLDQSLDADLLVLGHRFGRMRRLDTWSVDAKVVAHATCPVAVVGPFRTVPPGPSAARVVVGVDSPTQSSAAIGYAYHAAAQRGIGLTALHAWKHRGAVDLDGVIDDVGATEENERRVLDRALEGWERRFPGVSVEARLVRGCPARALITESAGAALTVVGSRIRQGLRRVLVGRMSQMLIRSAYGPVAVIRSTS